MTHAMKRIWHIASEHLTHWIMAGAILAATGAAPEHWLADLFHEVHLPTDALHLWTAGIDLRMVLAGLGLVLIVGDIAWRRTRPVSVVEPAHVAGPAPANAVLPLPDRPSIAVLPFANLSGDPEQEYFSDGVADDIVTELSRDHALFVIARNSSFTYRGRSIDVKQVGRELGVRYVVEGSVRREAGRVRISTQLIDTTTGDHVWAERYDRATEDVFALQDEIAASVATAIRPALGDAEQRRVLRKPPNSLSAWETYQRGLWHLSKGTRLENERAQLLFQQAAEIDPGFATAYVGLTVTHLRDALFFGARPFAEAARLLEVEARKAIAIDTNDSEAHAALCFRVHIRRRLAYST
jgi:adenylate cyclase